MQTQASGWAGKYKFGVNTRWGPGPVNTNLVPEPVNTRWGPGPVNTNWEPGPVNTNWGPGSGPGAGKYKHPIVHTYQEMIHMISLKYCLLWNDKETDILPLPIFAKWSKLSKTSRKILKFVWNLSFSPLFCISNKTMRIFLLDTALVLTKKTSKLILGITKYAFLHRLFQFCFRR